MEEREIVEVTPIEQTDWDEGTMCMSSNERMTEFCDGMATKEIVSVYDEEPDKRFYTTLCEKCAAEHLRKWDEANIFGDEVLE